MEAIAISLLFLTIPSSVFSANILVMLGIPFYSHQLVHYPLLKELLQRGHNLTIFTSHPMDYNGYKNVTQHHFKEFYDLSNDGADMLSQKRKKISPILIWGYYEKKFRNFMANSHLKHPELRKLYLNPEDYEFDLLIMECMLCPFVFLAEIYDCPVIMTSAAQLGKRLNKLIGNYVNPAVHSELFTSASIHGKLSFFERVNSLYNAFLESWWSFMNNAEENSLMKVMFPSLKLPSYQKVFQERLKLFYGFVTEMTTSIRPSVHNYQHIGFIHVKPPRQVEDSKLKNLLDTSNNGVIVMSFGSIAKDFDDELLVKFTNAFKQLPYNILWKMNTEKFPHNSLPKNILTFDWIPLADVLAHPNVKLLIGHSGTRTIEEAIDREVPMILFPLGYDQPFSANLHTEQGIALNLDLNEFTKEELVAAIEEIMKPKYKENVRKYRTYIYDRMMSSVEIGADHIELLIKNNETFDFQDYEKNDVNFFIEYLCDIHLILLSILCSSLIAIRLLFRF